MTDAYHLLGRALNGRLARLGQVAAEGGRTEPWASATFTGARHRFAIDILGPRAAAADIAGLLAESDYALPGHLVADLAVTARANRTDGARIEIEALTLVAA